MRTALYFLATAASTGCFRYVPATLDAVPVGAEVRAVVSTEAQVRLRDSLSLDARPLTGALVERETDRVMFQVRTGSGASEFGSQPLFQRIGLGRGDVLRVDERRVSLVRTGLLAVGIAGAAVFIAVEGLGALLPGTPEPRGGEPAERIVGW